MPAKKAVKPPRSSQPKGSIAKNSLRHAKADAIQLLQSRHKLISEALDKLDKFELTSAGLNDLEALCRLWSQHRTLEEEIAYPAFRKAGIDEADITEAEIAHDLVSILMSDLLERPRDDEILSPSVSVLRRLVSELIESKEHKSKGLFASAKKSGFDTAALADKIHQWMSDGEMTPDRSIDLRPRHLRDPRRDGYEHRRFGADLKSDSERNQPEYCPLPGDDQRSSDPRHDDDERNSRDRYDEDRKLGYRRGDEYADDRARYDNDRQTGNRDGDNRHIGSRSRNRNEDSDHPQSYRSSNNESEADRGFDNERSRYGASHGEAQGYSEASRRGWDERRSREDEELHESRVLRRRRNP